LLNHPIFRRLLPVRLGLPKVWKEPPSIADAETGFLSGRISFQLPNQQCQSTEAPWVTDN